MAPDKTRRWTRHQVKLPVRIIATGDASRIAVPGLTTEISRGGMALYGGVPLQPGDLMEVEFQTSNRLRIAGAVRDRNGYCFGLEFLTLLPDEEDDPVAPDLTVAVNENVDPSSTGVHLEVVQGASEIFSLFLERHEAYLQQKELEIQRMRQELAEIRQSRQEIETLARQFLGRLH